MDRPFFGAFENHGDFVEQIETLLFEPFRMMVAAWFDLGFDPVDRTVQRMVAPGEIAEMRVAQSESLQRLGIEMDVISAGEYKSAAEQFTRGFPSPENQEAVTAMLTRLQTQVVRDLAQARRRTVDQMQAVNTEGVEPLANPLNASQRLREDQVTEADRHADFQAIAPAVEFYIFLVPNVIDCMSE